MVPSVSPGYLGKLLPEGAPEEGEPWSTIQADIDSKILPGITHWQSPNFLAFFPANSSYPGILGELYSAAFTSANFNWLCSPAATELETVVLDWLCKLFALPPCYLSTSSSGGGGVIQGSASEAILAVIVAARDRYLHYLSASASTAEEASSIIDSKRHKLVALFSDQAHSSSQKGCQIAGVKHHIVKVPGSSTTNYILTGPQLRRELQDLTSRGLEPFYLTLSLGTTATCATDDFASIAEVIKSYPNLWVHVDAAYAGAALICPEYQHLTTTFASFDSFNTNMHKWLLTNFDCSALFVKSRKPLLDALSVTPPYLRNTFSESGLVTDYRDWQIPLGRRFRALKIWFVLRTYGVKGLQAHIHKCVSLGDLFAGWIRTRPDLFRVITPPAFALTVFTLATGNNAMAKTVCDEVNADGEVFITGTVVDGAFAIRVVGGAPKTCEKVMRRAFEILVSKAEEVIARGAPVGTGGVVEAVGGV